VIDSKGQTATIKSESGEASHSIEGASISHIAREFTSNLNNFRIFGQVGFNYAAHIIGQKYTPGN
jgi:salicylate synthetase